MFDLRRKSTHAEIRSVEEFDVVRRALHDAGTHGVLKSMEDALCATMNIKPTSVSFASLLTERHMYTRYRSGALLGEIFVKGDSLYMLMPDSSRLLAWELRPHQKPTQMDDFLVQVEAAIKNKLDGRRVRGMQFNWKDDRTPIDPRARLIRPGRMPGNAARLQTHDATLQPSDVERSRLFANGSNREFLLRLAKVGNKAVSTDASSILDDHSLTKLLDAGIVKKEYLLVCRQDSRTICSIPDRARLEETIGSELTCTGCGRAFTDELIQDIYALTPEARALLNGSQWMTIWVTECLVNSGVPPEAIKWSASAGDDELDIIADIYGLKVFFELKDRQFGLGDAYPFSFRVERYGGDVGVVVTMDSVAEEAQKFLDEQHRRAGTTIEVIEGEGNIAVRIAALVGSLSRLAVHRSVRGSEDHFGIDIWPFLKQWMEQYE